MKHSILTIIVTLFVTCGLYTQTNPNTDNNRKKIDLSTVHHPHPHYSDVSEPVVMYATNTDMLYIDLDPVYYSEYRVFIGNYLCETELFMTSASDSFSLALAGTEVTVTIESDDCGSWEGFVDKVALGGPVGN